MTNQELTFNQINACICLLPEEERKLLPKRLVDFFKNKATLPPEESLDLNQPLEKQNFTDESLLLLYYINKELKTKKTS